MLGVFELSATGLSLFVVAFCVLQLSARCWYLRSIFPLNVLALLHRCYREGLWEREIIVALLLYVSRSIVSYPGCSLFYGFYSHSTRSQFSFRLLVLNWLLMGREDMSLALKHSQPLEFLKATCYAS